MVIHKGIPFVVRAQSSDLGGRFRLTRKQRLELVENFHLEGALTPTVLMTRTARGVLRARSYFELLSLVAKPLLLGLECEEDGRLASVDVGHFENLSRINQVRVGDTVFIGFEDLRVTKPCAVKAPRDSP